MPRLAYAANKAIGLQCLRLLIAEDLAPSILFLPEDGDCNEAMKALLSETPVIEGKGFSSPDGLDHLRSIAPDYILSVHFPLLLPKEVLAIPTIGCLNLHPAYLPWNRGWHTPSWAILDGTPYGATLHWIDTGVDTGDIALQKRVDVLPSDTAHSLYQRALAAELELFREAIPHLRQHSLPRVPQKGEGTTHKKTDLVKIQELRMDEMKPVEEILKILRALTTNTFEEAAYVERGGKKIRLRLDIQ